MVTDKYCLVQKLKNRTCSRFGMTWTRVSLKVDMWRSTVLFADKKCTKTEG